MPETQSLTDTDEITFRTADNGQAISMFADDWTFEITKRDEGGWGVLLRLSTEVITWESTRPFAFERFNDVEG